MSALVASTDIRTALQDLYAAAVAERDFEEVMEASREAALLELIAAPQQTSEQAIIHIKPMNAANYPEPFLAHIYEQLFNQLALQSTVITDAAEQKKAEGVVLIKGAHAGRLARAEAAHIFLSAAIISSCWCP